MSFSFAKNPCLLADRVDDRAERAPFGGVLGQLLSGLQALCEVPERGVNMPVKGHELCDQ